MLSALRQVTRSASLRTACKPVPSTSAIRTSIFTRSLVTKRYSQDHEAVAYDDSTGTGTVSVTDYAQSSLGDVVFVELPAVGTQVQQGDQIGAVESVKAASDIYAPVSGTVEAINEELQSQPSLLNKSPEDEGWLCKIKVTNPAEIDGLMTEEAYKAHCES